MTQQDSSPSGFVARSLPWAVFGGALVLYLSTLCQWINVNSLGIVARVAGWDWTPALSAPLHFLVTLPFRALPAQLQPIGLNIFSAVMAALALRNLARSITLLPHDRTREQRHREQSEYSLLSIPTAWIPPLFGVLVCGLQLTFWEHATTASIEILDLLVFSYLILSLLEYRVSQKEGWLYRMAFLYGIGVTNNWALIGFFPCFLAAVIWIRGREFFQVEFIARMIVAGISGLGLYLLLPLLAYLGDTTVGSFWDFLRVQLGAQKNNLLGYPRSNMLLLSLTSALPMLVMGIRWPSSVGDTSAAGAALTNVMFKTVHAMFLLAILWVSFDPRFSPRSLGYGLPFLTFYYMGALAVGYFSGYFLLVSGPTPKMSPRQRSLQKGIGMVTTAVVALGALGVSGGLVAKNLPYVRAANGSALKDYSVAAASVLPDRKAVVLSDDSFSLMAVAAGTAALGKPTHHLLAESRSLTHPIYQRQLAKKSPDLWPDALGKRDPTEPIDSDSMNMLLLRVASSNEIYYAHPSFGYFFESFYGQPKGLAMRLQPYGTNHILPPPLTVAELDENKAIWDRLGPAVERTITQIQARNTNAIVVGSMYSRALNTWGVHLQRAKRQEEAATAFASAQKLNADNFAAAVNTRYNDGLRKGNPVRVTATKTEEELLSRYRAWDEVMTANGPFDEPAFCFRIGSEFARGGNFRQALIQYERSRVLDPGDLQSWFSSANMYLMGQVPDKVTELANEIRRLHADKLAASSNAVELVRLEAIAEFERGRIPSAEQMLRTAHGRYPREDVVLETLYYIYFTTRQFTNVLGVLQKQIELNPSNVRALLNLGATHIETKNYALAIPPLDKALQLEPDNFGALRNRAIAQLRLGQLDLAKRDYETLRAAQPRSYFVYHGLGEIAFRKRESSEAIELYEKFLEYAPRNSPEIDAVKQRVQDLKLGKK